MAVICRSCGQKKGISLPPVRTRTAPCDFCGNDIEMAGKNYDYPDSLMPGHPMEPNEVAEREENQ